MIVLINLLIDILYAYIDPRIRPDWPGYPVYVEDRPDTTGVSKKEAKRLISAWRKRRTDQERSKARIDRLMGGPCTAKR